MISERPGKPFTRRSIPRLVSVLAMAVILSGCTTAAPPSEDTPAIPSVSVPTVAGSDAPSPLASPTAESASPSDALEDVPDTEGVLNAIHVGNDAIVAGGFAGPTFMTTILLFRDGAWSVAETPDSPGQVTGIAGFGDRLVAVGNGLPDIRNAYIWDATDGRVWREVQTIEDAAIYDIVATEEVIIAVGARLDDEMNATATAWSSTDGTTWARATVAGDDGPAMGSVTTTPDGFAATGDRALGQPRPFWTATAPTDWAVHENDLSDQLLPSDLVHWSERHALVGASGRSGDQHPFIALSGDGARWETTYLSADEGYASAVAVVQDRLVVAGIDADRLTIWSQDGAAWSAETIEPTGASVSAFLWGVDQGLIAVGARDGRHALWSLTAQP